MRHLPSKLSARWPTGKLVGEAQHVLVVRIRPGFMKKGYLDTRRIDDPGPLGLGSPIFPPYIYKGHNHSCWQGLWTPTGPWITLTNIQGASWSRAYSDDGSSSLTVVMDNIAFIDTEGLAGIYHSIERGWYSPSRGIKVRSRPRLWSNSGWGDVLNGGYQLELWEGYGSGDEVIPLAEPDPDTHSCAPSDAAIVRTWTGIIEGCDLESNPDQITIIARDFGVLFTDQRFAEWNKASEIKAPVTFADYKRTMGEKRISGPYTVSSGHITDDDNWLSAAQVSSEDIQWVEMPMPKGHYSEFFFGPRFSGFEMWVSVHIGPDGGAIDRTHPLDPGWVDVGRGSVSGGGPPAMRHWATVTDQPRKWDLGNFLDVPDGSKIRISLSQLNKQDSKYLAGMWGMSIFRYGTDPAHPAGGGKGVKALHWVLVQDAADVVRMIFIWAGFKEWHVDTFGWSLDGPMHFGEDSFFIDAINQMLDQGNFVFHMGAPTDDDRSIGVPHFEYQNSLYPARANTREVRDTNMLEAATMTWDMSEVPSQLRYRGKIAPSGKGFTFETDLKKRWMARYSPPWGLGHYAKIGFDAFLFGKPISRLGGIRRYFTQTLGEGTTAALDSNEECLFACVLAALQYALQMVTGEIQIAGLPAFDLGDQVSVIDKGSGINSRMWVVSLSSDHSLGENGKWTLTIGGSYLDTEDMQMIKADYNTAYRLMLRKRIPSGERNPPRWVSGDPKQFDPVTLVSNE